MKKKLIVLFATFVAAIGLVSAKSPDILGTWKLIEQGGRKVPENYPMIKLITPTQYMWMQTDSQGNILDSSGGTYTLKGNKFKEKIDKVSARMRPYYNYDPEFEVSVCGKLMTWKGYMKNRFLVEIWEKID